MNMKMIEEIKLKPCPFCGREAEFVSFKPNNNSSRRIWYVQCPWTDCEVSIETFDTDTPQEAAELWNRRVNEAVNDN